jgi:predicted ATPase
MTSLRNIWLGRDREFADLAAGLDDLLAGRGGLFLVTGEPGIGKTRLSDEFARAAANRGVAVHWGRAWEAGGAPSYWPFVQVLRGMCRGRDTDALRRLVGAHGAELAELLPELKQRLPDVKVLVALWTSENIDRARTRLAEAGVDQVVTRLADAIEQLRTLCVPATLELQQHGLD